MRETSAHLVSAIQLALWFLFLTSPSSASCPLAKYLVIGTISGHDNKPVSGARVFIFLDENEHSGVIASSGTTVGRWSESADFAITSSEGRFEFNAYLDTYQTNVGGTDICERKPARINVFVLKQGYLAKRKEYQKTQFTVAGEAPVQLRLPAITLERDISIR